MGSTIRREIMPIASPQLSPPPRAAVGAVAAAVAVAVAVVFAPALDSEFVKLDDPRVILENPLIVSLDSEHLWRMATEVRTNWHPLTWLSHAADVALFGYEARGHHAMSVAIHAANAAWMVVLFVALGRPESASSRARLAAAAGCALVFGLHPLRVESVAWATERKDVLCLFFALPCLLAWHRYGSARARGESAPGSYALCFGLFACALMSKPMAVTLPLLLLVVDFYPLGRLESFGEGLRRSLEKWPFFAASLALGLVTIEGQGATGALVSLGQLGIGERLLNAVHNLAFYLEKTLAPSLLSPRYPLDLHQRAGALDTALASAITIGLTLGAGIAWRRSGRRALLAAWVFYVVALTPVSGLFQFGRVAAADRFGYLPLVGFHLLVGAAVLSLIARSGTRRRLASAVSLVLTAALCAALATATRAQIPVWHDTLALWGRVTEVFPDRLPRVHVLRGHLYREQGATEEAVKEYREALRIAPGHPARVALARAYFELGHLPEAEAELVRAIRRDRESVSAQRWLGIVRSERGDRAGAQLAFEEALRLDPEDAASHARLGDLARLRGDLAAASGHYENAVRADPTRSDVWAMLGSSRVIQRRLREAHFAFTLSLSLNPANLAAHRGLSRVTALRGDRRAARLAAERGLRFHPNDAELQQQLKELSAGGAPTQ